LQPFVIASEAKQPAAHRSQAATFTGGTLDCFGLRPRNDEKKPAEAGFLQCIRTLLI